jgi:hypothetical protein
MDASQYKDYVLTLLFVKYVSDNYSGRPSALIEIPADGTGTRHARLSSTRAPFPLDLGHLIPRADRGDGGIGITLVSQSASLNRGRTSAGRRWRSLENLVAGAEDAAVFVRTLYDDASDVPALG